VLELVTTRIRTFSEGHSALLGIGRQELGHKRALRLLVVAALRLAWASQVTGIAFKVIVGTAVEVASTIAAS